MIIHFKILSILLFVSLYCSAQWQFYSENENLISNDVNCFLKIDNDDLLIGTDEGLSFLSNGNFTNYNTGNGLIYNNVQCLTMDYFDNIWIGTPVGISVFDGFSFQNYTVADGLPANNILDFVNDTSGNIWIATNNGLSMFNGAVFINYNTSDGLISNSTKKVSCDAYNNIWIATSQGLSKFDHISFANYTTTDGLSANDIKSICSDTSIYIGTQNGLDIYNGSSFTNYNTTNGLANNNISDISIDKNGNVWICHNQSIITKFNNTDFRIFDNTNSIIDGNCTIKSVYTLNNSVFIGTDIGFYKTSTDISEKHKTDTLAVNNIRTLLNSNGWLFISSSSEGLFEIPIGSGLNSNFLSNIWLGAMDQNNTFHLAATFDYLPGPVDVDYNSAEYDSLYRRLWKVNKADVDYHIANWSIIGYIVPNSISDWPDIAEYKDYNSNGEYDPVNGDYPIIRGDQAILAIINDDNNNAFGTANRNKLNSEIHLLMYAFSSSDSALNNAIFCNYKIKNKSVNDYHNVYLGVYDDVDIGDAFDDFIGTDTMKNSYYIFNGDNFDADYGISIPAQGVTFLNTKMTSTTNFSNVSGPTSDPYYPDEYYNILTGNWKDGTPHTYGGNGYGGTSQIHYVFTGNPSIPSGWTEYDVGNTPGDRRGVGIVGPFDLDSGQDICIDVAYTNAIAYGGDNNLSVRFLLSRIDELHNWYNNQSFSCDSIITSSQDSLIAFCQDITVCQNTPTASMNVIVSGGVYPYSFYWTDETGGFVSDNQIVGINISTSTFYCVTVTDSLGNSIADTLTVNVYQNPQLDLGNDTSLCSGDTLVIEIDSTQFATVIWNNGVTQFENNILTSGNYSVIVTDLNGCKAIDEINVDFNVILTDLPQMQYVCINDDLILDAGADFISYQWSTGDNTQTISYSAITSGYFNFSVTVEDSLGCSKTDSILLIVSDVLPFVFLGNDTIVCGGILLNPGNFSGYLWQDLSDQQTYYAYNNGEYYVTVTDYNGCKNSDSISIDILTLPFVFIGNDTLISNTDNLILDAGGGFTDYSWNTGDTTQIITFYGLNGVGTYNIWVIVIGSNGCINSDTITIVVYDPENIDEIVDSTPLVYPNPTEGKIYVEIENFDHIDIFDTTGEIILRTTRKDIDLGSCPSGAYNIKIYNGNKATTVQIIKK